jgi:hypothetical protein
MSRRTSRAAAALLAVMFVGGPTVFQAVASEGSDEVHGQLVVTLRDDRIDESSGLVVRDGRMFTVNDSGDGPYLYEVDMRTGETAAVTTYDDEDPKDVEALAPGRDGTVWVGDIGDNRRSRDSVRVFHLVPPTSGGVVSADRFDLVYPDGPHDAETLLVHPRTGRVFVVTKSFAGGVVYEAPRSLRPGQTYRLERVGSVPGLITDGTFLPGGRHVLLRTYGAATVYSFPGFQRVADVPLPEQEQGEGIAVDQRRIYLSSEGQHSEVLAVDEPSVPRAGSPATLGPRPQARPEPREHRVYHPEPWLGLGPAPVLLGAAAAGGVVVLLVRAARRRGRRRP